MNKDTIKIFAPATIANIGPGYDIFGLALEHIGDTISMQWRTDEQIVIDPLDGFPDIPLDADKNIAGIVATEMLKQQKEKRGLHIHISKNVMPGSGLGSSGSSAAGAAFALNQLMGEPYTAAQLVELAMVGEKATSGKAHADNVAAVIMGGFTVIKGYNPLQVFNIPFPDDIHIAIVHPQVEVKTADSKKILKKEMPLEQVIKQCGNVAGMVAGISSSNYALIASSMHDLIAEPKRAYLIPAYAEAKKLALENNAIGCSISGSGPSIFAFVKTPSEAASICSLWQKLYESIDIPCKTYTSRISPTGAKIID